MRLQRGVGSGEPQGGPCTAAGPAHCGAVTAGQGAAARRGGPGLQGQVDLVVGLVGEAPGVAGLVAALAVGRVLGVEGAGEAGLGAGGSVLAQQHGGARLVQTHRPRPPALRLQHTQGCSEKLRHNLHLYCIACLPFHQNACFPTV